MIYTNTGDVLFKVMTRKDLSLADSFGIRYEKPDGTMAEENTGMSLQNNKTIHWQISDNTFFDQPGVWKFQSFAIFGGLYMFGSIVNVHVHQNIEP